jgi:hypothetical protein
MYVRWCLLPTADGGGRAMQQAERLHVSTPLQLHFSPLAALGVS